jgi:hypothetical protein
MPVESGAKRCKIVGEPGFGPAFRHPGAFQRAFGEAPGPLR